jgi:hypothetical protein
MIEQLASSIWQQVYQKYGGEWRSFPNNVGASGLRPSTLSIILLPAAMQQSLESTPGEWRPVQ